MKSMRRIGLLAGFLCALAGNSAYAKLPALTPEQQQAAEAKKQAAAALAEKEKEELASSMEHISERWRTRAGNHGWEVHPQVSPGSGQSTGAAPGIPVRSEKAGTAPPSGDIKNPAEKGK